MKIGRGNPPGHDDTYAHNQFGDTLNSLNLEEIVRLGREWIESVTGDPDAECSESGPRFSLLDLEYIQDATHDLVHWWAIQAGLSIRRKNPIITTMIDTWLYDAYYKGEPTTHLAFLAWLDRMRQYLTADCETQEKMEAQHA